MSRASEFLEYESLPSCIAEGLITCRVHPQDPGLAIYNYTARAAFDSIWTPETLACRGLILRGDEVVSRPFKKYFNLSQHLPKNSIYPRLPLGEPFEAHEKLDGSLAISYPLGDEMRLATRGSFESSQAQAATNWWHERFGTSYAIPGGQTWLFEWIAPDNRIVVDYGGRRELVLLAVIDNATGLDLPLPEWGGATARRYDAASIDDLLAQVDGRNNFEGFVIRFPSTGQRVKVKLDSYVRLHRLLTGCSAKTIWELLANDQTTDGMLENVPDEFFEWVRATEENLVERFTDIEGDCHELMKDPVVTSSSRREIAEYFKRAGGELAPVLFKMLDGRDFAPVIWKMLRPEAARPFATDEP